MTALEEILTRGETEGDGDEGDGDEGDGGGGDSAPDSDDSPTTPPEPEPPSSTALAEEIGKKLDQENARHRKTLARLMDIPVDELNECPKCETYGYLPPGQEEVTFKADPERARCETCDGRGWTETGAQPPSEEVIYQCSKCGGRGWQSKPPETTAYQPPADYAPPAPALPTAPPGYVLVPVSP